VTDKKVPVSVVISAVDNVTYRVMAINEKLKRITAPVGKVRAAFSLLGEEAGLGKLGKSLAEVGSTGRTFFKDLAGAMTKVTAVSAAVGGALYGIVHSFSEAGDNIGMVARRLGLTTDAYQELAYAANAANVPQEEFNQAMTKFSRGIAEAAMGTGEALGGFNALGVAVRDSHGHLKTMDTLLPEVAGKLGNIQNQSVRNAVAARLFGREGAKLNDIWAEGAAGLEKLRKEAHAVGAVMTPEQIKAAQDFDEGMKSITATVLSVRNAIGAALSPILLKLGRDLQAYILSHTKEIQEFANAFAANLPGVLDNLASIFKGLYLAVTPLIGIFNALSAVFGTTNVVAGGLLAYIGGPAIVSFVKFAAAIGSTLAPALRVAWVAFSLLGNVVLGLITSLAALVGWPVLIGAALIAVAVAVWKWWEPIKSGILSIWDKIGGFFGSKTTVDQNINTSSSGPSLGPAVGFSKTVDAAQRSSDKDQKSHFVVDFNNVPQGTRVETKKDDLNVDLYLGMAGAGI
jgi:hypothetical protein